MTYDTVIKDTIIIDGTGNPRFKGTIGIESGKIATIQVSKGKKDEISGERIVDCKGRLISAPGFIDMHSHSDLAMFFHKNSEFYKTAALCKISQGITTEIVGQDGFSAAPIKEKLKSGYILHWSALSGQLPNYKWKWNSIEEYINAVKKRKFPTKVETLLGHSTLRINVMGYANREPTSSELDEMKYILSTSIEDNEKQVAKGLSLGLIYPPGMYANKHELIELAKVVKAVNGVLVAHIRNESQKIFDALDEYIGIHNATNVRTHISHLKICGDKNIDRGDDLKKLIQDHQFTFDMYPYNAGSTTLTAILPPWAHEGGSDKLLDRLKNKKSCLEMASEVFSEDEHDWDNFIGFSKGGLKGIVIANSPKSHEHIIGKSLAELGEEKGFDLSKKEGKTLTFLHICDLLNETNLTLSMISFNQSKRNVRKFMKMDSIMTIGTDGIIGKSPHPRLFGAHTKYIQKTLREKSSGPSLEQAIHNITGHAAQIMQLNDRGVLKEGKAADITIFNPNTITDKSTWTKPKIHSNGILYVFVDGVRKFTGKQ